MQRVFAVARIVPDQTQVQTVVAGHDQGRIDRHLYPRPVRPGLGQGHAAHNLVVDQHRQAAEIRQHGWRIAEVEHQLAGLEYLVGAAAERNAHLTFDAAQTHALPNLKITQARANVPLTLTQTIDGRHSAHARLDLGRDLSVRIRRAGLGADIDAANGAGGLRRRACDRRDRQHQCQAGNAQAARHA